MFSCSDLSFSAFRQIGIKPEFYQTAQLDIWNDDIRKQTEILKVNFVLLNHPILKLRTSLQLTVTSTSWPSRTYFHLNYWTTARSNVSLSNRTFSRKRKFVPPVQRCRTVMKTPIANKFFAELLFLFLFFFQWFKSPTCETSARSGVGGTAVHFNLQETLTPSEPNTCTQMPDQLMKCIL